MQLRSILLTAAFTALIIVGSYIAIPVGAVPVTLQTLFVLLAGLLGGRKIAVPAVALYLVLGAVGLPVFSGGGGGFAHFSGPTGGFLIGLLLMAFISGSASDKVYAVSEERDKLSTGGLIALIGGAVSGTVIIYLTGIPYLKMVLDVTMGKAVSIGLVPFIAGDLLKLVVAVLLANIFFPVARTYLKGNEE